MQDSLTSARCVFMQPGIRAACLTPPQYFRASASQARATAAACDSLSPQGSESLAKCDSKHARRRPPFGSTRPHADLTALAQANREAADASVPKVEQMRTNAAPSAIECEYVDIRVFTSPTSTGRRGQPLRSSTRAATSVPGLFRSRRLAFLLRLESFLRQSKRDIVLEDVRDILDGFASDE